MKKFGLTLVMAMMAVMLVAGGAWAVPFSSTGVVDQNYLNNWDPSTSTGTALFEFYIDEDWPAVNRVTLEFENDIFDLSGIQTSDFTVLNPAGWTTTLSVGTTGYQFSLSQAGTPATSSNDPIKIEFDYTLLSPDRYNYLSGGTGIDAWSWDEGQPWGIAYTLDYGFDIDTDNDGVPDTFAAINSSSGSTAPVPEPGTMALLGIGLLGLAFIGRKKLKIEE